MKWNHRRAEKQIRASKNPIIIDNTNLEAWEMQPYICLAIRLVLLMLNLSKIKEDHNNNKKNKQRIDFQ